MAGIKIGTKGFLRFVLVVLIVAAIALIYLYQRLAAPPAEVYNSRGMRHVLSIYGFGPSPDEQLKQPHDAAFDKQGNIYITDTGHRRVLVFGPGGDFLRQLGKGGAGKGEFVTPLGIAVGEDGRVYVADESAGKVVIFRSNGEFLREFRVMMPLKPAVFGRRLYVANYAFVNIYDLSGRYLIDRWGGKGAAKGKFDLPTGLAVTAKDRIYVADLNNKRVQMLDSRGKVHMSLGGKMFSLPAAIAVDERDRLYVVDAFSHELAVFSADGAGLARFSRLGQKEGELYYPAGIAYGGRGLVAVADKFNDRVQLFRIDLP